MSSMTKDEMLVSLFDEVKRLQTQETELKALLDELDKRSHLPMPSFGIDAACLYKETLSEIVTRGRSLLVAATPQVGAWVRCDECLPLTDAHVLVWLQKNGGHCWISRWVGDRWSAVNPQLPPTHWMPLPSAPAGQYADYDGYPEGPARFDESQLPEDLRNLPLGPPGKCTCVVGSHGTRVFEAACPIHGR